MISLTPAIQNWITMLRTTQLPQATGSFKYDGAYCALGILCLANGKADPYEKGFDRWGYVEDVLGGYEPVRIVCYKNDNDHLSFDEIADWAEVYFSEHPPTTPTTKE